MDEEREGLALDEIGRAQIDPEREQAPVGRLSGDGERVGAAADQDLIAGFHREAERPPDADGVEADASKGGMRGERRADPW